MSTGEGSERPMSGRVGIRDVARKAGVGKTTAAYILRGEKIERFAEATREKVFQAARELGYVPNIFARGLKTGRSNLIAVYFGDIGAADLRSGGSNLVFARFFAELCGAGIERGTFPVTLLHTRDDPESDMNHLRTVLHSGVGGLLAYCPSPEMVEFLANELDPNFPTVSIFAQFPEGNNVVHVDVDNTGIGSTGVEYLIAQGYRKIVAVRDKPDLPPGRMREAGYRQAMENAGLEPQMLLLEPLAARAGKDSFEKQESGKEKLRAYDADAFFCLTAGSSARISRWMLETGMSYPNDYALIGLDSSVAENGLPFTSYTAPWASIAQTALEYLERRMVGDDADIPRKVLVPADFSPGETCIPKA